MMSSISNALTRANQYIHENKLNVNSDYRHQFHLMPPIGWMNDPNGFSYFQGEYHLFYQYYPYDTTWGPMHWGHAKTSDFMTWDHLPVALVPSEAYDKNGIFSGTAIVVEEELRLYYTGHVDANLSILYDDKLMMIEGATVSDNLNQVKQVQCLATSKDGIYFDKSVNNPILDSLDIPENGRVEDFRDPKVWQYNHKFYMVAGSKRKDFIGQVLFYVSEDGIEWKYLNQLTISAEYGTVWECPDIFELDGKMVLIFSPQDMPRQNVRFENVHSAIAFIGTFNYEDGSFHTETVQELDGGFDFYAPQSILDKEGNRVMIAWMKMWEREDVLHLERHGWNGSMTLPRVLKLKGDHLYQWPVETINIFHDQEVVINQWLIDGSDITNTQLDKVNKEELICGNVLDMTISFEIIEGDKFEMIFLGNDKEGISITFDQSNNLVMMNRMRTKNPIKNFNARNDYTRNVSFDCSKKVIVRIILDVSSIEVFLGEGEATMTAVFYPEPGSQDVHFEADGKVLIHQLSKWSMTI